MVSRREAACAEGNVQDEFDAALCHGEWKTRSCVERRGHAEQG